MKKEKTLSERVQEFFRTPKGYALAVLMVLTVIAGVVPGTGGSWANVAAGVGAGLIVDVAVAVEQQRKRIMPDSAVITGLIVALVLSSTVPWYICALTTAIALLSKHVVKIKRKPIFNPAAVGLALAILVFGSGQSWWGALSELPAWWIFLLLVGGMLVAHRVNKFPQVFAFLGAYFGVLLVLAFVHPHGVADAFRAPFVNSVLFLGFFMVTDPPTSPARYQDQVIFGIIAAVVSVADLMLLNGLSYLLVGLLAANGWNAWRATEASKVAASAA